MGDDPDRTVRAGRRRRTEGDPAQRERAEAPERHDVPPPSSGGGGAGVVASDGGGGGGGFNLPGGTRGVAGGGMGLLILCVMIAFFL